MRRYYYSGELSLGSILILQGELFHHIFEVCRIQKGQHFELLSPQGKAYLVCVESVSKKNAQVLVQEERVIPSLREPHIHLYLSFPKVSTFEAILEKSVEMGVKSITPFLSDFSHVRTIQQFPVDKLSRWKKIILQATQQSGRGDLLNIEEPCHLKDLRAQVSQAPAAILNVVAYEGQASLSLKNYLHSKKQLLPQRVHLFVGSEGGFSDEEVQQFQKLDLPPVTLGAQVLRVETACLTLVASLKYEFDLWE